MEAILALIGVMVIIPLAIIYSGFSWGWVLYKFWGWFLIPVFPQVHVITWYQAIGLMLVISLFKNHDSTNNIKDEYKDGTKWSRIGIACIGPWMTLLCGWIIWLVIR